MFHSCSTEKNTAVTRAYHNLTSRYNIFFNGYESYKQGMRRLTESHTDDFTRILPLFPYSDPEAAASVAGDMERTIQKATKVITLHSITVKPEFKRGPQTEKQKAFYEQNEFNKHVPSNYLLMGKAYLLRHDFHLAGETFRFILNEYPYHDVIWETQVWMARNYIELNDYDAARDILDVLTGDMAFPDELMADLYTTVADLHMRQENYESAIEPLTRAVEDIRDKQQRIRYTFILAQLHQKAGNPQQASAYFRDVLKMNPPYEFAFNARINRASVYVAGMDNADEILNELRKMLKDEKNRDFRDQIYYAMGNVYLREGNMDEAIRNYQLSSAVSTVNTRQKTTSCVTLADLYYDRREYELADQYYDSASVYLTEEYPGYEEIVGKTRSLGELVDHLQTIAREDSLQLLANMPEAERLAVIDTIIARLQREEAQLQALELEMMQDQQYNRMALSQSQRAGQRSDQGGKWYFYNQAAKGFGQPEFRMKWGNRKLEDNWRRLNKREVSFDTETAAEASDTSEAVQEHQKILSNTSREFYLQDIPLTDSMMQSSDERIMQALFNAGKIYREDLGDNARAIETYRRLISRYPENDYLLQTYYGLYTIYQENNNIEQANNYAGLIKWKFPESQLAQILGNPDYLDELEAEENERDAFYARTYQAYQEGSYDQVFRHVDTALQRYEGDPVIPKFEFLKVLAIGRTADIMIFTRELDSLARTTPDEAVAERANEILAYIMDTDTEVKTETTKIEAEELYRYDTTGNFHYGLLVKGPVDINQLKFEFINLNLDHYPTQTYDVSHEELDDGNTLVLVSLFDDIEETREYLELSMRDDKINQVIGDAKPYPLLLSAGNHRILMEDRVAERYRLFFESHYQMQIPE